MSDQCKHCTYRGDFKACQSVECFQHENWYAKALQAKIKELEKAHSLRDEISELLKGNGWGGQTPPSKENQKKARLLAKKVRKLRSGE